MKNNWTRNIAEMTFIKIRDLFAAVERDGFPEDFGSRGVTLEYNKGSGIVYFTNDDCDCAYINPTTGKLESYYNPPYSADPGFFSDLLPEYLNMHPDDQEFLRQIASNIGREKELPPIPEEEDTDIIELEEPEEEHPKVFKNSFDIN